MFTGYTTPLGLLELELSQREYEGHPVTVPPETSSRKVDDCACGVSEVPPPPPPQLAATAMTEAAITTRCSLRIVWLPGITLTSILFLSAELLTPYYTCTLTYLCSLSPPFGFASLFRRLRRFKNLFCPF